MSTASSPSVTSLHSSRRWRTGRRFYSKKIERWFLPNDMRDVRWDRDSPDPFAAHPAWSRARSAVHERPAPEGSWSTPVFSSRPTGAMFAAAGFAVTNDGEGVSIVDVAPAGQARRVIVVVERAAGPGHIPSLAARLGAESAEAIWISHPSDWCDELSRTWASMRRYGLATLRFGGSPSRNCERPDAVVRRDRRMLEDVDRAGIRVGEILEKVE
jgi:hypothetical protein